MKHLILAFLFISCSAPETKKDDMKILEALHEEPMRMGTKKVVKEGMITTEIWTYIEEHGSKDNIVETLIFKNDELVSHTISDSAAGHTFSRQFKNKKVIEAAEVKRGNSITWYFDESEQIRARMSTDGKKSECYLYTNGHNPVSEKYEKCERDFNTAP